MNIFYTHPNPHKCANEHCNVHQVKMILEYTQLLSTAHRMSDGVLTKVRLLPLAGISVVKNVYLHKSDKCSAQHDGILLLYSTVLLLDTHHNHPSAVWVRQSVENYAWLYQCLMQLHKLYSDRTGKEHKLRSLAITTLRYPPELLACNGFSEPPVAAPEQFKDMVSSVGVCAAYHAYLRYKFSEWLSRDKPMRVEFTTRKPSWL